MTSLLRDLTFPEAVCPFFNSPRITILLGEEVATRKDEHKKNTNFLSNYEPMQKGAFEHKKNTNFPKGIRCTPRRKISDLSHIRDAPLGIS